MSAVAFYSYSTWEKNENGFYEKVYKTSCIDMNHSASELKFHPWIWLILTSLTFSSFSASMYYFNKKKIGLGFFYFSSSILLISTVFYQCVKWRIQWNKDDAEAEKNRLWDARFYKEENERILNEKLEEEIRKSLDEKKYLLSNV